MCLPLVFVFVVSSLAFTFNFCSNGGGDSSSDDVVFADLFIDVVELDRRQGTVVELRINCDEEDLVEDAIICRG